LSDGEEAVKDRGQFKVEIPFYRNEEEKSVYYCIILKNKEDKEVKKVNKRYSDFKSLHLNMKSEMKQKKLKKELVELPYRGNVGLLVSNTDPSLIRFRKEALCKFLQKIENDVHMRELKCFRDFFE